MSDRLVSWLRVLVTAGLAAFVLVATLTADPPSEDRAREIGSLIRCPVCQGESIADSPAPLAEDMMGLVRIRIAEGWSDQQIIDELIAAYSGAQLLDPPLSGETLALWLIPALVLAVGIAAAASRARAVDERRGGVPAERAGQ